MTFFGLAPTNARKAGASWKPQGLRFMFAKQTLHAPATRFILQASTIGWRLGTRFIFAGGEPHFSALPAGVGNRESRRRILVFFAWDFCGRDLTSAATLRIMSMKSMNCHTDSRMQEENTNA